MTEFKKQYKVMVDESLNKLEAKVYFEINHEGWVPLGGAFFVTKEAGRAGMLSGWYQTLWMPEPFWKDETKLLNEYAGVGIPREEEEPEIFRDD